jgi:hypothetical protein
MKPYQLRILVENAAGKIYYPQCLKHIEATMDADFHSLARATLIYYLPSKIAELSSKQERRDAINAIPEIADPAHTKQFIVAGVKAIWKKRVV